LVPIPFARPGEGTPAKVVTLKVEMIILRIMLSPGINANIASIDRAMPQGFLNLELLPIPFMEPEDCATPATVVTEDVDKIICRIR
jgi:hypothetical protein